MKSTSGKGSHHAKKRTHPVLAVSMGDMNGIGPEVILKMLPGLMAHRSGQRTGILLFASRDALLHYYQLAEPGTHPPSWLTVSQPAEWLYQGSSAFPVYNENRMAAGPGEILLVPAREGTERVSAGTITAYSGKLSMDAVSAGTEACLSGEADALVTAPISKEAIHLGGFRVPGHTEYLADLTGAEKVGMMLVNKAMRVGLATIHVPLRDVAGAISIGLIAERLQLYHQALKNDFGISGPKIAVLGLNPHAGDGGVLGTEELDVIGPALEMARKEGIDVTGPWPADGFFGTGGYKDVDMVFAMYHDQGLIPLKLAGFGGGVNVTAGLPIIRTSPDHGTAFPLAGKNMADSGSMLSAALLALDMIKRRSTNQPNLK